MKSVFKVNQNLYYNPFKHRIIYSTDSYDEEQEAPNVDIDSNIKLIKKKSYLFPMSAGIFLTNRCPLKCVYCSDDSGVNAATLSKNQIYNYLKLIVRYATIKKCIFKSESGECFLDITGGGEPTSNFELLKYCIEAFKKLCQKAGIVHHIIITTNGVCNSETLNFLIANTDLITVSYDGMPAVQNRNRICKSGIPSDQMVSDTLRYIDNHNDPYVIRTTVGEKDYIHLNEMFDYIRQNYNHVQTWHIEPIYKIGRGKECETVPKLFAEYYLNLLEYSKNKEYNFQIDNTAFSDAINTSMCDSLKGQSLWLNAFGQLYGCATQNDFEKFGLGTVSDEGTKLLDVKADNTMLNYQEAKLKKCSECYALAHCGGGCPMNMPRNSEGELVSDDAKSMCNGIRYYWQQFIERLYNRKEYAGYKLVLNQEDSIVNGTVYDIVKGR